MMPSGDDDVEPQLRSVENFYFVDEDDATVPFDVLPFQFDAAEEVPSFKKDVYLRGFADGGLQEVYKQVVAWKLYLDGEVPEITLLSTEGTWIVLLKPKPSYEETVRSVLITVEMLHFVRRSPGVSEENIWDHLCQVFDKCKVRPSEDDLRDQVQLIKLFTERDKALAESQTLQLLFKDQILEKIVEASPYDREFKDLPIADDEGREVMVEDNNNHEPNDDKDDTEDEEDGNLFDSVCTICDNGGELLCCEGTCMRSFHAKIGDGEDSYCATLGYTKAEVREIKNFLCKNCEYKEHQCFVCGELEPSDGPNGKVFLCNNATCGHFYHPKCVAQLLHPNNWNEAVELEKNIIAGFSFTCPVHWCFQCKGLEDRTQEPMQFAVCRRCPRSYHRKCLPREIYFEYIEEEGIVIRAWDLSKRILIYCLDHDMDLDIGTPARDHLKFPRIRKSVRKKVKELTKKRRRNFDDSYADKNLQKSSRMIGMKSSFEQPSFEPENKKIKCLREMIQPEKFVAKRAVVTRSPKQPVKEQGQESGTSSSLAMGTTPQSSFPVVDRETEKRVIALVEKEVTSLTLDDISRRCAIPSTYASSGRQIDKIIAQGKLERAVQAVQAALQKLENGGTVDDAKAVCEAEVLRQLTRWNNKLRVYLAPFIHGMRYTSFGRHFTKKEKLIEIVDKLHWYVQSGDTIVDFSCGLNDFSQFMKEKLDKVGKKCNFKNYDVIQPKNSFCFEKRDWMTVSPKELPHGSKLIMGLNPPFGLKAILAKKFIDKALTFKPKLIVLIAPKETERLDKKRESYDLVFEDTGSLSGKSFYLPGSLDVADKQMDQWNVSPPPLYLWSHPDWTHKHRKIAEEHGHIVLEVAPLASKKVEYLDEFTENRDEVHYEQNNIYGERKETCMSKDTNFIVGKQEQVNVFSQEKHVEVSYEEIKVVPNRRNNCRENRSGVLREERDVHSGLKSGHCKDSREEIVSSGSRRIMKWGEIGDGTKADSDMSISPLESRNSWSDSQLPSEYPSEKTAPDDTVPAFITSSLDRVPYEDYIRNVAENGVASVEKHLTFSTGSVGSGMWTHSPDIQEPRLYAGGPNHNLYSSSASSGTGSFYRGQSFGDSPVDYMIENSGSAHSKANTGRDLEDARMQGGYIGDDPTQSATTATDIRAQIRMYGGHTGDGQPRTAMNARSTDIRAQIRLYGQQHTHRSGFTESSYAHRPLDCAYGIPSLGSTGWYAMDNYNPHLQEPNNILDNRPDMIPDPVPFNSRQQYPYPHPGPSGGWIG